MTALGTLARGACWAVVAVVVLALLTGPGGLLGPSLAQASDALTLRGDVRDLVPGGHGSLTVTVENPLSSPVKVRRIAVEVVDGGRCLTVEPFAGALPVASHGTASVPLRVDVAADPGCAERTWTLRYSASA